MPNWKKLIVSGSDATLNSLDVTNNISASNLYVKDEIIHHGDTNTKIKFTDDTILLKPGGANFIELSEGSTDLITLNRNVSASGHISSSGLYVESSTITDFIKLNSLGSSAVVDAETELKNNIIEQRTPATVFGTPSSWSS